MFSKCVRKDCVNSMKLVERSIKEEWVRCIFKLLLLRSGSTAGRFFKIKVNADTDDDRSDRS